MMGPPTAALKSYTWYTGFGCVTPRDASSESKLLDCMPLPKPEANTRPDIVLPPDFGMTLTVRPAVSSSPRPPDVIIDTSAALPMSAT